MEAEAEFASTSLPTNTTTISRSGRVMDDRKWYSRTVWAVCSTAFFAIIAVRLLTRAVLGH